MTESKLLEMNRNRERVKELTKAHGFNKGLKFTTYGETELISADIILDNESTLVKDVRDALEKEIKRLNLKFEKM